MGIVGPIGSGKSSILDAIAFALYGVTPRVQQNTKSLINQHRDTLHVSMTFEVGDATWRAVRSLRRKGAAAHALYRIDGDEEELVTNKAAEMSSAVEEMLGVDHAAFRRSFMLAQNQFAAFLDARPTERNQVLRGVFGFDRLDAMREIARRHLDGLGRDLAVLAERRRNETAMKSQLDDKRSALAVATERATALDALRDPVRELEERAAAATEKAAAADAEVRRLESRASELPDRASSDAVIARVATGQADLEQATAASAAADEALVAARTEVDAALAEVGGRSGLDVAADLVARWRAERQSTDEARRRLAEAEADVGRAEAAIADHEEAVARATAAAEATKQAVEGAEEDLKRAQSGLHAAHQGARASALRTELVAGEACPVCAQVVDTIPGDRPSDDITEAERAAHSAAGAVEAARSADAEARAEIARCIAAADAGTAHRERTVTTRAEAATAVDAADRVVTATAAELTGVLGDGDPEQLLAIRRGAADAAASAAKSAEQAATEARRTRDRIEAEMRDAIGTFGDLRARLERLAEVVGVEGDVGDDPERLDELATVVRKTWVERHGAAADASEASRREVEAATTARIDLLEGAGLGAADDLMEVTVAARADATALGSEVQQLEKQLEELAALAADEAETSARAERLERLHGDLAPSRFLEFVLDERRRALGTLAGEHLDLLTAGRYRFTDDGEFAMVDLAAADGVRASTSLSGGETFLASLALALALAEMVTREGGRLDSFFLDEGFGSLDPDHLDLAMDGIERLVTASASRLVVVVSHVPALMERIDDLIVLDRDGVTGTTAVVAGASMGS